jgi:hypothetical protein
VKLKLWTLALNAGDGSASVLLFSSSEKASSYLKTERANPNYEGFAEDCIQSFDVEIDADGRLAGDIDNEPDSDDE